jgi:hypothetical protein
LDIVGRLSFCPNLIRVSGSLGWKCSTVWLDRGAEARIIAETYERRDGVGGCAARTQLTPQQLFGWRRRICGREHKSAGERRSTAFCAGDCGSTPARQQPRLQLAPI